MQKRLTDLCADPRRSGLDCSATGQWSPHHKQADLLQIGPQRHLSEQAEPVTLIETLCAGVRLHHIQPDPVCLAGIDQFQYPGHERLARTSAARCR